MQYLCFSTAFSVTVGTCLSYTFLKVIKLKKNLQIPLTFLDPKDLSEKIT